MKVTYNIVVEFDIRDSLPTDFLERDIKRSLELLGGVNSVSVKKELINKE